MIGVRPNDWLTKSPMPTPSRNQQQQQRLIRRLAAGDCQGLPDGPIEHIETHISHILLAGNYAYKIKKPLNLGFLDYTRLALRRHYCEEEIRLNQRLAPELYLDCIPITGSPDNPTLGGPTAEAIEFAVRMRRFDQQQQFDLLVAHGALKCDVVRHLSEILARFHRTAEQAPGGPWGQPDAIQAPVEDNFSELFAVLKDSAQRQILSRLQRWTRQRSDELRAVFETRNRDGWVRECHGDLHLGNIALIDQQPVIFDCIEFSPALRWIDIMSEVAFLWMDLQVQGHAALARVFLDRYLQFAGDYDGLRVLSFYAVYRALVRTKIAAIREDQTHASAAAGDEVEHHLQLALRLIEPSRPLLVITHGVSGSGKSTLSEVLVESMDIVWLRADVVRKQLHGLDAGDASGSAMDAGIYSPGASRETYRTLAATATRILDSGWSAVIDATNLMSWQRQLFRDCATAGNAEFLIIDCRAPQTVLRRWIQARMARADDPSEADVSVMEQQLNKQQELTAAEIAQSLRVRTDSQTETMQLPQRIKDWLSERTRA